MSRRRAVAVLVAGVAFAATLAVLAWPDSGRLERVTTPPPPTFTTGLTKTTRTTHVMDDDETLVRKLAERYLEAVNTHDDATIAQLNCAKAAPGLIQIAAEDRPVSMTGLERAPVRDRYYALLTIGGKPGPSMTIVRQDGVWCVWD